MHLSEHCVVHLLRIARSWASRASAYSMMENRESALSAKFSFPIRLHEEKSVSFFVIFFKTCITRLPRSKSKSFILSAFTWSLNAQYTRHYPANPLRMSDVFRSLHFLREVPRCLPLWRILKLCDHCFTIITTHDAVVDRSCSNIRFFLGNHSIII